MAETKAVVAGPGSCIVSDINLLLLNFTNGVMASYGISEGFTNLVSTGSPKRLDDKVNLWMSLLNGHNAGYDYHMVEWGRCQRMAQEDNYDDRFGVVSQLQSCAANTGCYLFSQNMFHKADVEKPKAGWNRSW